MSTIDPLLPTTSSHDPQRTSPRDPEQGRGGAPARAACNAIVLGAGPVLVVVTVVASVLGGASACSTSVPSWALAVALAALVLGVPHGAVDHLALARSSRVSAGLPVRTVYVVAAAAAALAILCIPGPAFVVVLAMSVWHFGTGDVEAVADLSGRVTRGRPVRVVQALALGAAPVLLPLTGASAVSTVQLINPGLAEVLTPAAMSLARYGVLCLILLAVVLLARDGNRRGAAELALLAVLGLVASPLVAFAVYFASWHALRHTARLAAGPGGDVRLANLGRTFAAGVPALVVTVAVAAACVVAFRGSSTIGTWMWVGLALVWGLTVPHMIVIARFDRARSTSDGREAVQLH